MYGYMGKILYVNLTSEETETEDLDVEFAKKYVGGFGFCLRLAYDLIEPRIDPLSPSNALIMGAGPLTGARFPAQRFTLVTKQPMTSCISFNSCGGNVGRRFKAAGYDCLVITGRAEKPVYLKIVDDEIEILDAKHLWGKGIWETTDELWKKYGKKYSIIPIGQAGENLVPLAITFVDELGSLGRGGAATVMGSKNLKAIAVSGTKRVKVSDPQKFRELTDLILMTLKSECHTPGVLGYEIPVHQYSETFCGWGQRLAKHGTEAYSPKRWLESALGRMAWRQSIVSGKIEHVKSKCPGCPLPGCCNTWTIKEGEYKDTKMMMRHGAFYEGAGLTGKLQDLLVKGAGEENWTVEQAIRAGSIMNEYGICVHTFGPTMSLAVNLYERGIITKKDTEGMVLKGDVDTAMKLIEMVAFRKGIGDVLAGGTRAVIKKFGGEEYTQDVKGITVHFDPRLGGLDPCTFESLVNPEGGIFEPAFLLQKGTLINTYSKMKKVCEILSVPKQTMDRLLENSTHNLSRLTPYDENFHGLLSCLDICVYYHYPLMIFDYTMLAELYTAATGIKMTANELRVAADRIWNLYKALNVREGQSRKDDRPPAQWFEPYKDEVGELVYLKDYMGERFLTPDLLERLLDDYYDERGWDVKRGIPSREKLMSLGLEFAVEDLKKSDAFYSMATQS